VLPPVTAAGRQLMHYEKWLDRFYLPVTVMSFSGLSREEINAGSDTLTIFGLSIVFCIFISDSIYTKAGRFHFLSCFAVPIGAFGAIITLTFYFRT